MDSVKMSDAEKAWIDGAPYEDLLRRSRFAPAGDAWFQGERGEYHLKVMAEKRNANPGGAVGASKRIGW